MPLKNRFVGYIDRSYEQVKQAVIAMLPIELPEMTDHSESNPLIKLISIWSGISEMIGYYVDLTARESFLVTARKFKNKVKHAKAVGYRVQGASAASVTLRFFVETPTPTDIIIPVGTSTETDEGIAFFTTAPATITAGGTEVSVSSAQRVESTGVAIGISDGSKFQSYEIAANEKVVDGSVLASVAGTVWEPRENFLESYQASEHYVAAVNESNRMAIEFGDDVKGLIPGAGQAITADYATTEGAIGNVARETITTLASTVSVPAGFILKVTNPLAASGGGDGDDGDDLTRKIPLWIRTNDRAVTETDYADTAKLVSGVGNAGVLYECGKFIEIYIAPEGGGIASNTLKTSVFDYVETKKMITTHIVVKSAGQLDLFVGLDVEMLPGFESVTVKANVEAALLEFFAPDVVEIGGRIMLNDIVEVVENVAGVRVSEWVNLSTKPYARPINLTTTELDWTRTLLADAAQHKWRVKFFTTTDFQVIRDDTFLGNHTIGTVVSYPSLEFTINVSYTAGQEWEFYTYPINESLRLQEPSVPTLTLSNISINITTL